MKTVSTEDTKIENFEPGKPEFEVENKAHSHPWSWTVFSQSVGEHYRCRRLTQGSQVIGFTICQRVADELTLHNIAVDPAFQGRGYGNKLMQDLLDYASDHQYVVFLEVRVSNSAAIRLYEQNGFDTVGRRLNYYPLDGGREDALVMRWSRQQD
ncbi:MULTISPECIES: ribosomal protein S18-alanine N-acetyltransferase [Idiomarina]|jgi:ribosomal-protein-alanine N-acetyltransferase|uniref:[Ribosomal protein bS18]-alanine N-acetyltransferase n=1 Tax=Idiomarina abyssalis TaxID=86102 RepID=A0A8I1KHM8_9GAMM|nr:MULTISPECIES: ribosomal protein S18-alanine N-acetyltransferase [Idiomarina]MBF80481.1 ribosomal-protein-alanine N-acetyltransferase [Idiomarina sp.]MBJ7266054.1 ribosomal protein S18-alanine N-acetyltransferase [Idiomarina abyssalis]MBJ7272303.1 ribosomal protein S18-alanine N-acetyltransferase [Idiomarina abyssalis]MBJ7315960.1 ribosomal protein S18-alanine N-acetyltransferase [Idiomarina abyssalis]|tara:strand:+ start:194 stop:655 length:462 start_codon:yes stop_codon:yes gene_type:complete